MPGNDDDKKNKKEKSVETTKDAAINHAIEYLTALGKTSNAPAGTTTQLAHLTNPQSLEREKIAAEVLNRELSFVKIKRAGGVVGNKASASSLSIREAQIHDKALRAIEEELTNWLQALQASKTLNAQPSATVTPIISKQPLTSTKPLSSTKLLQNITPALQPNIIATTKPTITPPTQPSITPPLMHSASLQSTDESEFPFPGVILSDLPTQAHVQIPVQVAKPVGKNQPETQRQDSAQKQETEQRQHDAQRQDDLDTFFSEINILSKASDVGGLVAETTSAKNILRIFKEEDKTKTPVMEVKLEKNNKKQVGVYDWKKNKQVISLTVQLCKQRGEPLNIDSKTFQFIEECLKQCKMENNFNFKLSEKSLEAIGGKDGLNKLNKKIDAELQALAEKPEPSTPTSKKRKRTE